MHQDPRELKFISKTSRELCNCRGQWPKVTSGFHLQLQIDVHTPECPASESSCPNKQAWPFLNGTFFSDLVLLKCHYELTRVSESHGAQHRSATPSPNWPGLPYQGLPPPAFVVYHVCGINLLWVSCRILIFHSNDSIVMIFLVYSEWLQALK